MNIETILVYACVYHWIGCEQSEFSLAISISNVRKRLIRAFRPVLSSYHPLRKSRVSSQEARNCSRVRLEKLLRFSRSLQTFRVFHKSITPRCTLTLAKFVHLPVFQFFPSGLGYLGYRVDPVRQDY